MCELQAPRQLAMATRQLEGGGRGDLRIDTIRVTDYRICAEFNKKMDKCSAPLLIRQDLPNSYW
jgi:hypothetical protein